ncbi:MAG: DNA topoisomerase, partial [Clostridiales bacterium]|nr:DNA topoisomerase [Clostridiales bacterium]
MKLIIAEKPELGRAIAKAISGTGKTEDSIIYKGDYAVIWAYGHLLTLKDPEDYDVSYKTWSLDALPIYFENWGKKPNDDGSSKGKSGTSKKARLNQIGGLLKKCDCVIHAGDPDDEGQYLIDEILQWFKYKGPVYRMNTNDTTPAALNRALQDLKDNKTCENIGWSAHARSVADMMVGYNCSRYFSLKNPQVLLTIGRVQTSTLGLVVMRDMAIENHVKQFYYIVNTLLDIENLDIKASYTPAKDDPNLTDGKILDKAYAENKAKVLYGKTYKNAKVTYKEVFVQAPLPFNLTELQSYCSNKFGYEPTEVLNITQSLRDNYAAITYNRSDCQYLSEEQYKMAPGTLKQAIENLGISVPNVDPKRHSRCFDDSRISAHTAIIPQNTKLDISKMTDKERNVYVAICNYYIAQFLPETKQGKTSLNIGLDDGGALTATSTVTLDEGYRSILKTKSDADEKNNLSHLKPGTYTANVKETEVEQKETKPPARYTKASLSKDMTRIAKYVEDSKVKELLLKKDKDKEGENGSIGTVATRGPIIDKLVDRGYFKMDGKKLISTPLGRELYRILPDELKKPDMTAYWWSIQEDIQQGKCPWTALTDSVLALIQRVVKTEYPAVNMSVIPAELRRRGSTSREILGTCPRCGGSIIEGKNAYGCSEYKAGCKFTIWKTPPDGKDANGVPYKQTSLMRSYEITPTQIKAWLKGGWKDEMTADENGNRTKTGCLITCSSVKFKKLYSKNKDKFFEGELQLVDDGEGSAKFKLIQAADKAALGQCPRCGGDVKEGTLSFSCVNSKKDGTGCNFVIWKKPKGTMMSNTTITAANVRTWLSGSWFEDESDGQPAKRSEKTVLLNKLVSSKTGKTYSADVCLIDNPNNKYGPGFKPSGFSTNATSKVSLGKCPRCGGDVVEGTQGFFCTNSKADGTGCHFTIWKKPKMAMMANSTITAANVKTWLSGSWLEDEESNTETKSSGNTVHFNKLVSSKTGKTYAAEIYLIDDPNSKYGPGFKVAGFGTATSLGKCPRCGGDVTEVKDIGYGCSNYKENGCKFFIGKKNEKNHMLSNTTITTADVKKLLKGDGVSKSSLLKKDGSKFTATLFLQDTPE